MIDEIIIDFYRKCNYYWAQKQLKKQKKEWIVDTLELYNQDKKYEYELNNLKRYGASIFPYEFSYGFNIWKIRSGGWREGSKREPYVIHKGKKLFIDVREYALLLIEQNRNSPHRYFTDSFNVEKGDVFVDVGAAEGLLSMDVIDKASKIILIECDKAWNKKLNMTFEKYLDKVTIIPRKASDKSDEENITLDELLIDENRPIMIKMDVEGMEKNVLDGAEQILKRDNVKVAICTYHHEDDADFFERYFKELDFRTEFSDGYMAMVYDNNSKKRFRKAVLRCWK